MDQPNPYRSPSGGESPPPPAPGLQVGSSLDFGRSFGFFFQDPNWIQKLLIGSLFAVLTLVFIGSVFLGGYMIRLIRRASRGETHPLPEWDDLGGIFAEGLTVAGVYLVYVTPVIVLALVLAVLLGLTALGEGEPSPAVALLGVFWWMVLAFVLLAIMVFLPAVLIRLALQGGFRAAFDFEEIFAFIRRNIGNYLMAILVFILANFVSQVGLLLLCVGIFPASFWATSVGAYAFGEVAWRDPAGTAGRAP